MKVRESITIRRPPSDVFAFFDERLNDKRWMAAVIESEWVDKEGPTRLGRRGRMVMNAMGRREFADEVIEYEPGRLVAHRSVSDSMIVITACIAEPDEEGSLVTMTFEAERMPGGPFGKLIEPLAARAVRRNYRADMARLKAILEDPAERS
jgi:uncharacterized membrane protein